MEDKDDNDDGSVLMWVVIVVAVVMTSVIVLLGCIALIVIPMFNSDEKGETKREKEEEATEAMVMYDVPSTIENENFQMRPRVL
jgi:flagellar basal body-associated protein FliL